MKKSASILDYSYPFLDPAVWDHEQKLYSYHKDFILRLLEKMYVNYKLVQPEAWITDIRIIGSLTTSKWLFTSDMDVHMVVDLSKFIELNMPGTDPKIAYEYLDNTRKEFDRAKILAPMTQHPIEYYFEVPEFVTTNTTMVGVYSLSQDKWLKDPVIFDADVDFEESKKQVMTEAESIAQALDGSFGKIDRQIDRIKELETVIGTWGPDKQQLFYNKIEEKLKGIEAEIMKDLELRQALIDARHAAQDPMADIEIKFKWLQRFGFFGILSNLKELMKGTGGQVTLQELPLIKKIVTEAAKRTIKNPGIWEGQKFWSGMADTHDGQIYEVHTYEEAERAGFHHSFYVSTEAVVAMREGDALFFWVDPDGTINTAWGDHADEHPGDAELQNKIRSQISLNQSNLKAAFLKEALEKETETDICIDLDKTIAKPAKYPEIGEPIEGAKEALEKLQDLGYNVVIYSCRGDEENGVDLIKEYLDKHDIPYDSIFEGNKPFAKFYIDDRAIAFDNWDNVLKQVEKSEKKASLGVTAKLNQKYWIDPSGKEFPVDARLGHYGWVYENVFKQQYTTPRAVSRDKAVEVENKANEMISQGWTRVTTESDYDFALEVADLSNLPSYLDNFVAQHYTGGGIEIDDLSGEYQDLADPFPSLRKAIYQARRLRNAASKVFSKRDIKAHNYDVLGDPSLRQGPPRAVFNFVQKGLPEFGLPDLDMFDVLGDHPRYGSTLNRKEIQELNIPITEDKVAKQAKTKKVKQGDYSCIMAMIPHGIAQEIVEFGVREIPDEDLYTDEDGNLGRELQAHVTIEYGLLTDDAKHVRRSFNHTKPFKAKLGKVRHFQPPERDFDVVTVEVVSEDLNDANRMIVDKFPCADDLPSSGEYKPHITVAYVKRNAAKKHIGSDEFEGIEIELDTLVFSPRVGNKTYFSIGTNKKHASIENVETPEGDRIPVLVNPSADELLGLANRAQGHALRGLVDPNTGDLYAWEAYKSIHNPMIFALGLDMNYDKYNGIASKHILHFSGDYVTRMLDFQKEVRESLNTVNASVKQADFLPSLTTQAPDNDWQFADGGDDKEIGVDPDAVSDETTYYAPCTVGKPRSKDVWRQFISMFSNLFSKNDTSKIEAVQDMDIMDPELQEKEKEELGEDQTAHEYSKDFKDLNGPGKPHNTQWFQTYQDQEPSKPLPVTYSPQISNEDNLDQNSPGGYPRRFMGKPKGEWFSNEGEVNNALIQMLRNKTALIESTTKDITADLSNAYWIDPSGKMYQVRASNFGNSYKHKDTHDGWIDNNLEMLKNQYGIEPHIDGFTEQPVLSSYDLINLGWVRIGDSHGSGWGVTVKNLNSIPSSVDTCLSQFATEGAKIEIEDQDNGAYETIEWPAKSVQQAVNRARTVNADLKKEALVKQYALYVNNMGYPAVRTMTYEEAAQFLKARFPEAFASGAYQIKEERMKVSSLNKKIATIEHVDGINVFINPTQPEMEGLAKNLKKFQSAGRYFRGLIDPNSGDLFVWDAYYMTHEEMIDKLGIELKYSEGSPYVLWFGKEGISNTLNYQQKVKQRLNNKRKHTAGSQSASVPDYLIDEWKTEQINNDTDEEPYVNHDQRDYPYGMHDSPENTDSGIGWPKDNQPSVVHLNTLENPAFRLDPFGIGEYNVTYYTGMPASDGIEKTNPE